MESLSDFVYTESVEPALELDPELNEMQLAAISKPATTNLRIMAGPGTGKTKTLVSRVIALLKQGIDPEQLLLVCFTSKAVKKQRQRLRTLIGPQLASRIPLFTFHSYCQEMLIRHGSLIGMDPSFRLLDEFDQEIVFSRLFSQMKPAIVNMRARREYMFGVHKLKTLEMLEGVEASAGPITRSLFEQYNQALVDDNFVDYDDLLLNSMSLLKQHRELVENNKVVLVDEFQDLSSPQWELTKLVMGPNASLSVVGDPFQSIYSFQGANPHVFQLMDKELENVETVTLNINYRSSKEIVALTHTLVKENNTANIPVPSLRGQFSTVAPSFKETSLATGEVRWIAQQIQHLIQDCNVVPGDIAVLCRMNFIIPPITQAVEEIGIPIAPNGYPTLLKKVLPLFTLLKCVSDPNDEYLRFLLRHPRKLVTPTNIDKLMAEAAKSQIHLWEYFKMPEFGTFLPNGQREAVKNLVETVKHVQNLTDVPSIVEYLARHMRQFYGESTERMHKNHIKEFLTLLEKLSDSVIRHSNPVSQLISLLLPRDELASTNQVTISTIHSAKGLEWPVVFIPSCEEGQFPSFLSKTDREIQEELRVLYVGMTRAQNRLFVSFHNSALNYSSNEPQKILRSRFLTPTTMTHFEPIGNSWSSNDLFTSTYNLRKKYPKVFNKPVGSTLTWLARDYHTKKPASNQVSLTNPRRTKFAKDQQIDPRRFCSMITSRSFLSSPTLEVLPGSIRLLRRVRQFI